MPFQDFLRNNSQALLSAGTGLLSGRTPQEQVALAAQSVGQQQQTNKTLAYLQQAAPEYAQAVQAGVMTPSEAFAAATQSRTQKQPVYDFQTLPDGTYGTFDKGTGQFNALGKAPKPNEGNNDFGTRQQQAQQLGMTPDDPRYQSYILTGKFPREDAQPLTATDKKAILEADEAVSSNANAIGIIDQALKINDKANSGFGASVRATAGNYLPDALVPDMVSSPESSQATTEYDNLVQTQALQQLKTIFGGNPTEGERAILLELQASSNKPPAVRANILNRAKELASKRLEFNQQRANELRGGTYYKPGGSSQQGNRTSSGVTWSVEP